MIGLLGYEPLNERSLYAGEVASLDEWPETIEQPRPHFAALVAADVAGASAAELSRFAHRLLAQGAVYLCAWGPGCERLHDAFDAAGDVSKPEVATTWHEDDTLVEALWFSLFASIPDEAYLDSCRADLTIVVGNPEWAAQVRARLVDPGALWRSGLADA